MSGQGLDGHIIFHHALNLAASLGTRGLLEGSWRGFGGVLEGSWRGLEGSLRAQQIICPPRVRADTHTYTYIYIYVCVFMGACKRDVTHFQSPFFLSRLL